MKRLFLLFFLLIQFLAQGQSVYTSSARLQLQLRFDNGYVTGSGFSDDITRAINGKDSFLAAPSTGRPTYGDTFGINSSRQIIHYAALFAYAYNDVTVANAVMSEFLATVNANDMSDPFWATAPNFGIDWDLWLQSASMKKMKKSYELLKDLQTTLNASELTQIETFINDYAAHAQVWIDAYYDVYWGAGWETNGISSFLGENLYSPTDVSNTSFPIEDVNGDPVLEYTVAGAQNNFNNRIASTVSFLHSWSIYESNSTYENLTREWFKNCIRYALWPDGTFFELQRNKNTFNINALGVLYSFSTLSEMVQMAHFDAMAQNYPNDKLYDFETTEGLVNGSTNITTNPYLGGSTTDGTTLKSLKTFILGQAKYYNGGWSPQRYYGGSPLDMTGTSERDYSIPQAVANLYYKDQDIEDFYKYNSAAGYPTKDSYLDGSYEGSDGVMGTFLLGASWFELENTFFQPTVEKYPAKAKTELQRRFTQGYVTGSGFYDDISRAVSDAVIFEANTNQYPLIFGDNEVSNPDNQLMYTSAVYAYSTENISLANAFASELLTTVNANDLYTTYWNTLPDRLDNIDSFWVQSATMKRLYVSYGLIEDLQNVLTVSEKRQIENWFARYADVTYQSTFSRLNDQSGSTWQENGRTVAPDALYPVQLFEGVAVSTPYPIYNSGGNINTDFIIGHAQDSYNNRLWDIVNFIHLWAIKNNDRSKEIWVRNIFKEWLRFGVFPDGTMAELWRNKDADATLGIFYSFITLSSIVSVAHYDAIYDHFPDDRLYDFETTDGFINGGTIHVGAPYQASSTTDGTTPKNLLTVLKANSNYLRTTANGGWNDVRFYQNNDLSLSAQDITGLRQPSTIPALANLYYKDQDLEDWYLYNEAVGYPAKVGNINEGYFANSTYFEDYGAWGSLIMPSMWVEMEDYFFAQEPSTNLIYTAEAKAELASRFQNGYTSGTGFSNDIALTISQASLFLANPSEYRYDLSENLSIDRRQQRMYTTALHAYALDNVSEANTVVREIHDVVAATDLNSTFWNNSSSYRFDGERSANDGGAMWQRTGVIHQMFESYHFLKNLQTELSGTEENEVETWFQRYKELAETATKNRIDAAFGSGWENSLSLTWGNFENQLYPSSATGTATPITDAAGTVDSRFVMILGQDYFNNRQWDAIKYIHAWAIENNDTTSEYWTRQFLKMAIKFGTFPDGTFWELYRNRDTEPTTGIFYTNISLNGMIQMAHLDAMVNNYPSDKLYDYSTSDGVANGTTTNSLNAYTGSGTTDGTTQKTLETMILAQAKYYRTSANGGWTPERYFTSFDGNTTTLLDPEGVFQPSVQAALANLYYKNSSIQDYYLFNTVQNYPAKQSLLVGSLAGSGYDEDYGAWGSLTQGSMWLGMENYFFLESSENITTISPGFYIGGKKVTLYLNGKKLN